MYSLLYIVEYPEVPSNLSIQVTSLQPLQLLLLWHLYRPLSPSSCYQIILNTLPLSNKTTNQIESKDGKLSLTLTMEDFKSLTNNDSTHSLTPPLSLSLQASNDHYTCPNSAPVLLPPEIVHILCPNIISSDDVIISEVNINEGGYSSSSLTSVSNGPPSVGTGTTTTTTDSLADIAEGRLHVYGTSYLIHTLYMCVIHYNMFYIHTCTCKYENTCKCT